MQGDTRGNKHHFWERNNLRKWQFEQANIHFAGPQRIFAQRILITGHARQGNRFQHTFNVRLLLYEEGYVQ